MSAAATPNLSLTPAQQQAVAARGNVLVMAGAGTGKTKTLVERCLDCLAREGARLDELLIVTFTEAAATEMRLRLRRELELRAAGPADPERWREQLALFEIAHIGTLHSFCYQLTREHFHELGLDPRIVILEEAETKELAATTLDQLLEQYYGGNDDFSRAVQNLIRNQGGNDEKLRALILRVHRYAQTRADAARWLGGWRDQFAAPDATVWTEWLTAALTPWREEWLAALQPMQSDNPKAVELVRLLIVGPGPLTRETAATLLAHIAAADGNWPPRQKTKLRKPLEKFFDEASFLATLVIPQSGSDPLQEDWQWVRGHMATLLELAQRFGDQLAARKQREGVVDFQDLEQYALQLLWDAAGEPTPVAAAWRKKLRFLFVDEYQDINAAQDRIIAGLAGPDAAGNRFLVGDVKQSIYRFRLADPEIFRNYTRAWREPAAGESQVVFLTDNFRSRAGVLDFVNSLFSLVMHEAVGGVGYVATDRLQFGAPEQRASLAAVPGAPRVELLLRRASRAGKGSEPEDTEEGGDSAVAELDAATREARVLVRRLQELCASGHVIWDETLKAMRPVAYGDIAVLLRSPRGKAEVYAKEFACARIPLVVTRGGFFDSIEILDVVSLLQLLDNPLQDIPLLAVLRSPFGGFTLAELAHIRLAAQHEYYWTALNRAATTEETPATREKIGRFLERFGRWRWRIRRQPLAECLSGMLAETYYLEWWRAQPRGETAAANVLHFLHLAEKFDLRQRQGLARFLEFIEARRELTSETGSPPLAAGGAVRLLSIHQSKGLEFPVVALPDLAKSFNDQDLRGDLIFDEQYGVCPQVKPPTTGRRYPSLPWWLAQRRQKRELRGEELRLLYVALTRARDTLLLLASVTESKWENHWTKPVPVTVLKIAEARSYADWLGLWFAQQTAGAPVTATAGQLPDLTWRWVEESAAEATDPVALAAADAPAPDPLSEADLERLTGLLAWQYPHAAATQQKAKTSVTELRRAAAEAEIDTEAVPLFARPIAPARRPRSQLSAAEQGIAHHKFMQRVELFAALATPADLAAEADRLAQGNFLTAGERAVLDLAALAQFWNSPLGCDLRAHAGQVRRELPFTVRFTPAEVADITGQPPAGDLAGEFLIVQGAADLVVLLAEEIWLVDFKTDHIDPARQPAKVKTYTPQVNLYAAALAKIFQRPVTRKHLHFFATQQTVAV